MPKISHFDKNYCFLFFYEELQTVCLLETDAEKNGMVLDFESYY